MAVDVDRHGGFAGQEAVVDLASSLGELHERRLTISSKIVGNDAAVSSHTDLLLCFTHTQIRQLSLVLIRDYVVVIYSSVSQSGVDAPLGKISISGPLRSIKVK